MPLEKVDVAIVLGGQIVREEILGEARITPASHTKMRGEAALAAYRGALAKLFIVCGGHCFGVRYDPTTNKILEPPDFSFSAMARASSLISESEAIKFYITVGDDAIPKENVIVEGLSLTTAENAQCTKIILSRTFSSEIGGANPSVVRGVGIITQTSHMERALREFCAVGIDAIAMPVECLVGG